VLLKYELVKTLSQVPVILFPIDFSQPGRDNKGQRSICIRTFITNDFMTGIPALPCADHARTEEETQASPSPSPSPYPATPKSGSSQKNEGKTATPEAPKTGSNSPATPAVAAADTYNEYLAPVAAAAAAPKERIHLSSVRFPTMPLQALQEMVEQILRNVPGIARVCFDLTSKPPATTEWE
jgi:hypothetical protein